MKNKSSKKPSKKPSKKTKKTKRPSVPPLAASELRKVIERNNEERKNVSSLEVRRRYGTHSPEQAKEYESHYQKKKETVIDLTNSPQVPHIFFKFIFI